MKNLANRERPMKWGVVCDQTPLMGRHGSAHGIHAWAVANETDSESRLQPISERPS